MRRRYNPFELDFNYEEAYKVMIATEAEGDEGGPIDITADDAEAQSFGEPEEGGAPEDTAGGDEGAGDDIAANAEDATNQSESDMGDDMGDPGDEGGDGEDMDTPSADDAGGSDDMGGEGMDGDIYTDPEKIAETKQLMVHLYNNIKESIETISSISLIYPIKTDRLDSVKNDLLQLNSIIFKIVTSKKESKNYPELLKKYYGCKEYYGVKLEIAIQIIKDEISEQNRDSKKHKKNSKRNSNDTK